ncbi:MAG: hypothetical protein COV52_02780 [Gammaproteobacteria bacterium CG11_big_fil_rev_8_21_14_0_20_46_22]|nr:MAG: hypothetical protein COW05_08815 [Gammaproteobacteria bacterium CG12_big_fil_rev_8_21_14_0_65_46_12]PIR11702.1 MAG: hypothetical protein COV52_02780 [Gammaproteobacteria bacterium CG11_big_fil_rev_8_21_14_0_20_46_22]
MANKHVLLVDDEPISLKVLVSKVRGAGYDVKECDSGECAWEALQSDAHFDVIVLDRIMPGLDGMALLQKIQADARLAHIPIIMLTAVDDSDEIIEAISAGVFDYLTKPVDGDRLLDLLKAL